MLRSNAVREIAFLVGALLMVLPTVESRAAVRQEAVGKRDGIWPQLVIPVCWENPDASDNAERELVRNAVNVTWETFSPVRFVGWGACSNASSGIRILITDDQPHVKALGRNLSGLMNGMVLNFAFNNWSQGCRNKLQFCIHAVAVHEFGHAVGLTHEHNRTDARRCGEEPQGPNGDWYLTPYDIHSVMNYCNPQWNGDGRLSRADIVGVQLLYGIPCGQWSSGDDYTVRLYAGQTVEKMIPFGHGLVTAFSGGGIYRSPTGISPGGGCDTQRLYVGQRARAMVPLRGGIVTAFDGGGIYFSPNGSNPGGGGATRRLYVGQKVLAMTSFGDGIVTAFDGGGIYLSPDGENPGGGGKTQRVHFGQLAEEMIQFRSGLVIAFRNGEIYFWGGTGKMRRLYSGQLARAMIPFREGIVTAFSGTGIYYSPDGENVGGGGRTARLYQGQGTAALTRFRTGFVASFEGGGIYYTPSGEFPGGFKH